MYISIELIIVVVLVIIFLFAYFKRSFSIQCIFEKSYCKNILDSSENIILLFDSEQLISANRLFFDYFQEVNSLEEFSKKYNSIDRCFEKEEGSLLALKDGVDWREYLTICKRKKHKVKMKIEEEYYYFSISYSLVDKEKDIYALVLLDITEQERLQKELLHLNTKDELTEIGNKKFYSDELSHQITLAHRYVHPFSLILFNIDSFQKINDTFGYEIGNKILKKYTNLILHRIREVDIFCRIQGDSFALVLPHTTEDKAYILAEKLRILIDEHKQITPETISLGVVGYIKGDDTESIYNRAEIALEKAKESGKNRVVLG